MQFVGGGVAVQHFAIGVVADRMDADLIALAQCLADHRGELVGLQEQQAAVVRVVGIGLEHGRTTDRKRVVSGKSGSVRVDFCGGRVITEKENKKKERRKKS